jgi:hypothetical protein
LSPACRPRLQQDPAHHRPPQAAILAVGSIKDVPVVQAGEIVPGKRLNVTLSADHRLIDGAEVALPAGRQGLPGEPAADRVRLEGFLAHQEPSCRH